VLGQLRQCAVSYGNHRRATLSIASTLEEANDEDLGRFNDDCAICRYGFFLCVCVPLCGCVLPCVDVAVGVFCGVVCARTYLCLFVCVCIFLISCCVCDDVVV